MIQKCAALARSEFLLFINFHLNGSWAALTALDSLLGPPDKLKLSSMTAWTLRSQKKTSRRWKSMMIIDDYLPKMHNI